MRLIETLVWGCAIIDVCLGAVKSCQRVLGHSSWYQDPATCAAMSTVANRDKLHSKKSGDDWDRAYVDFAAYGYSTKGIPMEIPLSLPPLLHEDSVVRHVDSRGEFVFVDSGADAHIFRGEHRETGKQVVIKHFIERDLPDIMDEATMHMYLQDTGFFPELLGFLPSGRLSNNMSLVIEYVTDSDSLWDVVNDEHYLTPVELLDIALQVCQALLDIHSKLVLYNDLHSGNVLIQRRGHSPRVVLIDAGHATFRSSMTYSNENGSLDDANFYAPEIKAGEYTSIPTDVFGLGYVLEKINKLLGSKDLGTIAARCLHHNAAARPSVRDILAGVKKLYKRLLANKKNIADSLEDFGFYFKPDVDVEKLSLPFLLRDSTKPMARGGSRIWLSQGDRDSIYLGQLVKIGNLVAIKVFTHVPFESIRKEAAINMYLNDTGYVPAFFGLRCAGPDMSDMSIVQEFFADGITAADVIKKITPRDEEFRFILAREISRAVATFHAKGVLLNMIKSRNILVDVDGSEPKVKFIGLSRASVGKGVWMSVENTSIADQKVLAPEIRNEMSPTSWASDVYNLCHIFREIFTDSSDERAKKITKECLQKTPNFRPSAQVLSEYLDNAVKKSEES